MSKHKNENYAKKQNAETRKLYEGETDTAKFLSKNPSNVYEYSSNHCGMFFFCVLSCWYLLSSLFPSYFFYW